MCLKATSSITLCTLVGAMAIFRRTGATVHDPATGLSFPRLDLLAALDRVMLGDARSPAARG